MNTLEHIRMEIIKAQDALAEARDALLRLRRTGEVDHVTVALRRAGQHIAQAVEACARVRDGIV